MNLDDIYDLSTLITGLKVISFMVEEVKSSLLYKISSVFTPLTEGNKQQLSKIASEMTEYLEELESILKELDISKETQKDIQFFRKKFLDYNPNDSTSYIIAESSFTNILKEIEESSALWEDRISIDLKKIPFMMPFLEGSLDSQKLLQGPGSFFTLKPEVWENLKVIEKNDFKEFINSYLNRSWTAAGIMAMRIIESTVRTYYTNLTHKSVKESIGYFFSLRSSSTISFSSIVL